MATAARPVQASNVPISRALWFRFLVRTALVLLAFGMLKFAEDRYFRFLLDRNETLVADVGLWLLWVGATVVAGVLFGLAAGYPFGSVRFVPGRLVLAAVALVPVVHFWLVWGNPGLESWFWFDTGGAQFTFATLAGVAVASGVQARTDGDTADNGRFRAVVRVALALLAFVAVWFAQGRFRAIFSEGIEVSPGDPRPTEFPYDRLALLSWVAAMVVAGLLFGLASWLPFTKVRFLTSRLLLAAVTLVPVAYFWWLVLERRELLSSWLGGVFGFDTESIPFALAALAGVAIASGFSPDRSEGSLSRGP